MPTVSTLCFEKSKKETHDNKNIDLNFFYSIDIKFSGTKL